MKIDPKARMGYLGVMTVGKFGMGSLSTCYGEGLPSIGRVFAHVCEQFKVPKEWRHLNRFTVVEMKPDERLPTQIVLVEKQKKKVNKKDQQEKLDAS